VVIIPADAARMHLQLLWQRVSETLQQDRIAGRAFKLRQPTASFCRRSDRSSTVSPESILELVNAPLCYVTMVSLYSCFTITFHRASVVASACLGSEEILKIEAFAVPANA
jgi:hypothetical protein